MYENARSRYSQIRRTHILYAPVVGTVLQIHIKGSPRKECSISPLHSVCPCEKFNRSEPIKTNGSSPAFHLELTIASGGRSKAKRSCLQWDVCRRRRRFRSRFPANGVGFRGPHSTTYCLELTCRACRSTGS